MTTPPEVSTERGYDRWASSYDSDGNPLIALDEREFPSLVGAVAGLDVLDVGCGTGRHAVRLAAGGARVTAVDFSSGMLSAALDKAGAGRVRFLRCDLHRRLPLEAASFDCVLTCLVVEHIAKLPHLFAEMARVARPGGRVVVTVMHPAMNLKGSQARFVDPETQVTTHISSERHVTADYLNAAVSAGLVLERAIEAAPDEALAARFPRAAKYIGWPMFLGLAFSRSRGR